MLIARYHKAVFLVFIIHSFSILLCSERRGILYLPASAVFRETVFPLNYFTASYDNGRKTVALLTLKVKQSGYFLPITANCGTLYSLY